MSDIQKFDPSTLVSKLRERIKDSIAELIPQEQWDQMLKKEVDEFFKASGDRWNYKPSSFSQVVQSELEKIVREQVKVFLSHPDYQPVWKSLPGVMEPGEAVKKMAIEAAPVIMQNVIAVALTDFINSVKNSLDR